MKERLTGVFAGLTVVGVCAFLAHCIVSRYGAFFYPLDDAYIHMAVARNLSLHGVWGIEPEHAAFCSSAPLWTLLLTAVYKVMGMNEYIPLVLATAFSAGVVYQTDRILTFTGMRSVWRLLAAFFVIVAAPLTVTGLHGMEHALHAFAMMAFMAVVVADKKISWLCLWGFIATGTRFESLFVILPVLVVNAVLRRRYCASALVFVFAVLPVLIYGFWAISQGGYFLPNSLLLKGHFPGFSGIFARMVEVLGELPDLGTRHVMWLLAGLAFAACCRKADPFLRALCLALFVATIGHLTFAETGSLFRYETYLVTLVCTVLIATLVSTRGDLSICGVSYSPHVVCVVAGVLSLFLLRAVLVRGYYASRAMVIAPDDVRCQQAQIARIFNTLPPEEKGPTLINDLGYLALHAGCPVIDIWGLGTQDVAELIIGHGGRRNVTVDCMRKIIEQHRGRYMAVFRDWYAPAQIPDEMVDVGVLKLRDLFSNGGDEVIFRARGRENARILKRHLENLPFKLPERARLTVIL